MKTWTYEKLKEEGLIIFECIAGSRAYGTNTPTSDTDIRFVYILPLVDMLGLNYAEQVNNPSNDITGYELRRFMELLATANPTVIELLGMPEDVILHKHPVFDLLLEQRDKFLTKLLRNSMSGYARQQIQKAKGQDKMMNWEQQKVERKTPLDFCYVTRSRGGSEPLHEWLGRFSVMMESFHEPYEYTQADLGVVPVPHMKDMYELHVAQRNIKTFPNDNGGIISYSAADWGFRGLVGEDGESNGLRMASVPKHVQPEGYLCYNKDGYSTHCKDYNKYQEWLLKRNDARWTDTQKHGQKIDGKNMLHCRRLIEMAKEIASGQGVIVRRNNAQELLAIRRGEVDLEELLEWATKEITSIDELFNNSNLPKDVNDDFRDELLTKMRLNFYRQTEPLLKGDNLVEPFNKRHSL